MVTDAIIDLCLKVANGLQVDEHTISKRLESQKPTMAMESILMKAVSKGGNRQELHEVLREYYNTCTNATQLVTKISEDTRFGLSLPELKELIYQKDHMGMALLQTDRYVTKYM